MSKINDILMEQNLKLKVKYMNSTAKCGMEIFTLACESIELIETDRKLDIEIEGRKKHGRTSQESKTPAGISIKYN